MAMGNNADAERLSRNASPDQSISEQPAAT